MAPRTAGAHVSRSRVRIVAFTAPAALALVNLLIIRGLFTLEYSRFMASIEGAYIAITRYMIGNWRDLSWFSEWYSGIPFQNTYPPLLHALAAATAVSLHVTPALAHHAVCAFFYCAGPLGLYALARRLSGSPVSSFAAALLYSLLAPSAILMASVRNDIGGVLLDRRLHVLLCYGEGPHIAALSLIPLALLLLDIALDRRTPLWFLAAAGATASVALTNWLGAFGLALGVAALLTVRAKWRDLLLALFVGLIAYLIACPWLPPSTIATVQRNAQVTEGDYRGYQMRLLVYIVMATAAAGLMRFIFVRARANRAVQFFTIWSLWLAGVVLSAEWLGTPVLPQPLRYHLEMDLALCPALVFAAGAALSKIALSRSIWIAAACMLLIPAAWQTRNWSRYARRLTQPIDIQRIVEYQTARWVDEHARGERVFFPGSQSFWLNAFTDADQFGGGFDQGIVNPAYRMASYQIYSGEGAGDRGSAIALTWLRIFSVRAIGTGGPHSREAFKPFRHIERFNGLPVLWRDGDDVLYSVPQRSTSLARVIAATDAVSRTPLNGADIAPLQKYAAALEDPSMPIPQFTWRNRHSALIRAALKPGEVVSVRISFHPGWRAAVTGAPRPVHSDAIGFMIVDARCAGTCEVTLDYNGGLEMSAAMMFRAAALLAIFFWMFVFYVRRAKRDPERR